MICIDPASHVGFPAASKSLRDVGRNGNCGAPQLLPGKAQILVNADQSLLVWPLLAGQIEGLPDRVLQKRLAGRSDYMAGCAHTELLVLLTHSMLLFTTVGRLIIMQTFAELQTLCLGYRPRNG